MEKESKTESDNVKDNTNPNNANDPRNQLNFNSILNPYSINPFINPNIYQVPINNTPFIYPLYNPFINPNNNFNNQSCINNRVIYKRDHMPEDIEDTERCFLKKENTKKIKISLIQEKKR